MALSFSQSHCSHSEGVHSTPKPAAQICGACTLLQGAAELVQRCIAQLGLSALASTLPQFEIQCLAHGCSYQVSTQHERLKNRHRALPPRQPMLLISCMQVAGHWQAAHERSHLAGVYIRQSEQNL